MPYFLAIIFVLVFAFGNVLMYDRPAGMIFPGIILAAAIWIVTTPRERTKLNDWGFGMLMRFGYVMLLVGIADTVVVFIFAFH